MKSGATVPATITAYIAAAPPAVRPILRQIRATIAKAVPGAKEGISYRMPTFFQDGVVIHFAAFKEHIGVFPPVKGDAKLMREIAPYAGPKGNLRFPLDEPMPYALIGRIAKARLRQNRERAKA